MENLKATSGRVVVWADLEEKNYHTFSDGTKIRRERQYNEFNKRISQPVNATVIDAENIPSGARILVSHNALHDTNRVFDYKKLSGGDEASDIKYYSLPEADCFAWIDKDGNPNPLTGICFAWRVYKPYTGTLEGIEPELIPNVLYIYTGELTGNVCHVLKASDYEIIYQGDNGREARVLRCRHFEGDEMNEREEVTAIAHDLSDKVNSGEYLIGLSPSDAKQISINAYAD